MEVNAVLEEIYIENIDEPSIVNPLTNITSLNALQKEKTPVP